MYLFLYTILMSNRTHLLNSLTICNTLNKSLKFGYGSNVIVLFVMNKSIFAINILL